ncbi:unnamed protein product [Rotaria socialis]|uniref:Saccharopine dehydrogenase n=1 Tax=Rotaria socialis TaxID=392032 RepID=A0A821AGD4_9BILA|nr:unnamed protein product [Rotaria socialis]
MKILILGGYGIFGSRLARLLASQSQLTLFIAARSIKHAKELCNTLHRNAATIHSLYLDRDNSNIETQLRLIQPDLLVDASGPFQSYGKDPYRVIKACLATSINYIDFADGSDFVKNISQFDTEAKANDIYILSGASTCPALTAAVVRRLAKGLTHIHSIRAGITPSPYADVGLNVIRAIASYSGKQIAVMHAGRLTFSYGFTETMRYTICPPGHLPLSNRRFSLVDVPDIRLLPDLWSDINTIWVGAGPMPEGLHRMLNGLAWLARWRLIPSLTPFAKLFYKTKNIVRWGEHRGGMFVSIEGIDNHGQKYERSWHLIAEGDVGPFIPSMGAAAIIHCVLDGKIPARGARPATMDLELEDYERLFSTLDIHSGQWDLRRTNTSISSSNLYKQLLCQAWDRLPQSLQTLHSGNTVKVIGIAQVERGTNIFSRCIAIWQASGSGHLQNLLIERFGPFSFHLALVVTAGKLHLVVRGWSLFGIRLPGLLAPSGNFYEFDDHGRFNFHVEIKHTFTGLIVRYCGWLMPAN